MNKHGDTINRDMMAFAKVAYITHLTLDLVGLTVPHSWKSKYLLSILVAQHAQQTHFIEHVQVE